MSMQNRTVRERRFDIDIAFAVMIGCLLIGVLAGVLAYCFMDNSISSQLIDANTEYLEFRKENDFGRILIDSFFVSTLFIGAEFLCGLFALGLLPALGVLIYKGMGIGVILSQGYTIYESSRIVSLIAIIVPAAIVSCYGAALAAKEAVRLSGRLLLILFSNDSFTGLSEHFRAYGVRFLCIEAIISVSAAVDCVCSVFLASKL